MISEKKNKAKGKCRYRFFSILCAAVLAAGCLSVFTGCSSGGDSWHPAGMKLASSEDADYKMWVPEGWTVDMSTGVTSAYAGGGDYSNVSVTAQNLSGEQNYLTPAEYWETYKADLETTFPDIAYDEDTAEGISLLLGENAAMKYSYTATVPGTEFHFISVVCIRSGTVYLITYTAQPAIYEKHLEEVQSILDNFTFNS